MKIGVVGGGSVGLLVSSYLSQEHTVTVYVRRTDQKKTLNDHGIFLSHLPGSFSVRSLLMDEMIQEDCFIICVKQPQLSEVMPYVHKYKDDSSIVFLQNGMGHIDLLQNMGHSVFLGVVEHGVVRESDNLVQHKGKGAIKIATYSGSDIMLKMLEAAMNQPDFPVSISESWSDLLHEKLIINAVINPLTALFDVPNGEVLDNPYIHELAKELCRETAEVLGLDFPEQWNQVKHVAGNTGKNVSSMLKDIREHRQTEVEAITGYLLEKSTQHIPYTTFVYQSIKALEMKKRFNSRV